MPTKSPDPRLERLLTITEVCARLGLSRQTVTRLWKDGKLERVKFGRQIRIRESSLNALLDEFERRCGGPRTFHGT